jgi:acyl carrier protein
MVTAGDAARLARLGAKPLPNEHALRLFDLARGAAQAHLVPLRLDRAALRAQAGAGVLAPIAHELVRASVRRSESQVSLAAMLARVSEPERPRVALDLVRGHVAAVLGHQSPLAVDPDNNFKDMGFDSLAAVELRNRLVQATGLRLPSTVVFDHPTPALTAAYLLTKAAPGDSQRAVVDEELDRLEGLLRTAPRESADRIRRRLRSMLGGVGEDADRDLAVVTERRIEAASADEILELVSEELEKTYEGLEK